MHIAFLSVPVSWVLIWLWLTGCCDSHISDLKQRTWSLSPVTNVPISDIYSANKISINFSSDNEFYIHCWHRFFTCCKILTRPDLYNSYEADVTWEHDDSKLWTPSWISIGNPSSHYVVVRTVSLQNWNVLVFCFIPQAVSSLGDYDMMSDVSMSAKCHKKRSHCRQWEQEVCWQYIFLIHWPVFSGHCSRSAQCWRGHET